MYVTSKQTDLGSSSRSTCASMSAPLVNKQRSTSTCPFSHAMCAEVPSSGTRASTVLGAPSSSTSTQRASPPDADKCNGSMPVALRACAGKRSYICYI